MSKTFDVEAFELRRKLFNLMNEFKSLQARAWCNQEIDVDVRAEMASQLDKASCELATVYNGLDDLFIDATRDEPKYKLEIE